MDSSTLKEFKEKCKRWGWKCTLQRLAIYQFLYHNHGHPDIDTVWQGVLPQIPTITRDTVYRILNEFCEKDIIERVDHIDSARYDSRTGPHGHYICQECGKICDFDWPESTVLPRNIPLAAIKHTEIRIVGICPKCAEKHKF